MSVILEKELVPTAEKRIAIVAAKANKAIKKEEDEDLDDDDDAPVKKGGSKASDDDDADIDDDAEGDEGDDDWDPDFEEFDLPKSRKGKGGKDADEEEDFKIAEEEEDFKELDLFDDGGFDEDEDDF